MSKNLITDRLLKIGVFYDGNYFLHVSNFYTYVHSRHTRLSVAGLHQFICHQAALEEGYGPAHAKIADAHYFRGRLSAQEASQKGNLLYHDRVFDDILMAEGIVTHYTQIKNYMGKKDDRGIEINLSLEAFELAGLKKFDVVVLIGSDGDYVPLARKLNTLGTRVMLVHWEFEFTNEEGHKVVTRTSSDLISEATYVLPMHAFIDAKLPTTANINNLFVQPSVLRQPVGTAATEPMPPPDLEEGEFAEGTIHSLKAGYGFIKFPPNNLFFHYTSVLEVEFATLAEGDAVEFLLSKNQDGQSIATHVKLLS